MFELKRGSITLRLSDEKDVKMYVNAGWALVEKPNKPEKAKEIKEVTNGDSNKHKRS